MENCEKTVVALGLFDGVHFGHRAVLNQTVLMAEQFKLKPCVFTFQVDSVSEKQGRQLAWIYDAPLRASLLMQTGIQQIEEASFASVRTMSGVAFAKQLLTDQLHAAAVVCGTDFRFGYRASCGVAELKALGDELGFTVTAVSPVLDEGKPVSSSRVREAVSQGNLSTAERLLGMPYLVDGIVQHGNQVGRLMGFPTANILLKTGQCLPRFGVYAAMVFLSGDWLPAVVNVGVRPTVGAEQPLAEVHLLQGGCNLYGKRLTTALLEFLRPERSFPNLDALQHQIQKDTMLAEESVRYRAVLPAFRTELF